MGDKNIDKSINIFDMSVFSSTTDRLLSTILPENATKKTTHESLKLIFTPNPEQVVLAQESREFLTTLQQADILIPDGVGLIIAQKMLHLFGKAQTTFKEQITGIDLVRVLLPEVTRRGWRVLIIGGHSYDESTNKDYRVQNVTFETLTKISQKNPKDKSIQMQSNRENSQMIAKKMAQDKKTIYWLEGYRDIKKPTDDEEKQLTETIKIIKPDIVFVAFGAPYQEKWSIEHKQLLQDSKTQIVLVVGGAFDIILGKLKRAPLIVRQLGLEWLFRLVQEPQRWKRQLKLLTFIRLVLQKMLF